MEIEVNETKKINRKDEILKQATILFRKRGYAATSVRDLAHESGIEAPSLYSHFKSKEDILQRICFHTANSFMIGLSKAEKKKKPEDKLKRAIKEHVRVVTQNLDASAVMWNEWKHLTKPDLDDFKVMLYDYEIRFKRIIKKGMKSGSFKKGDPLLLSNLILSTLNGVPFWYSQEEFSAKNLNASMVATFYKGILNKNK